MKTLRERWKGLTPEEQWHALSAWAMLWLMVALGFSLWSDLCPPR